MAAPTLYIFPHFGGNATYYVPFAKSFTTDIKRIAVQYPGRQDPETLTPTSIPTLADEVFKTMTPSAGADGRVAFFGHSMGGLLAFEVAERFQKAGHPIDALFVSSCAAPGHSPYKDIKGSDPAILKAFAQATRNNPSFMANDEVVSSVLSIVASVRNIAGYTRPPEVVVSCPIHAFLGDNDMVVAAEYMQPWRDRTTGDFTLREFSGDHFYFNKNMSELVKDIESTTSRM